MRAYFGYVRVSTARQGKGVSLDEQRASIAHYAKQHGLILTRWFEETETAAATGRKQFSDLLTALAEQSSAGVIIHRIDRSARNLKDWANLGELLDKGVDVRFAGEHLDMQSRSGRLSADIQAVVAADYIRNLREETKKGFYGRLRQGLYPLAAPIGYLDCGGGRAKEPDPDFAPLVAYAFETYASGLYSLETLAAHLTRRGFHTRSGKKMRTNTLSAMLNNSFYTGEIRIGTTGEVFQGIHTPLISRALFDQVQTVLRSKRHARIVQHDFLFRRLLRCSGCGRAACGERQKGHVYYRCHIKGCVKGCVREEVLEESIRAQLGSITLPKAWLSLVEDIDRVEADARTAAQRRIYQAASLAVHRSVGRREALMNLLLDGVIDRTMYEVKEKALADEIAEGEAELAAIGGEAGRSVPNANVFQDLWCHPLKAYDRGTPEQKRNLLLALTDGIELENLVPKVRFVELLSRWSDEIFGGG